MCNADRTVKHTHNTLARRPRSQTDGREQTPSPEPLAPALEAELNRDVRDVSALLARTSVVAQPIFAIRTGAIVGLEFLTRDARVTPPALFAALEACPDPLPALRALRARVGRLAADLPPQLRAFLNLTPRELREDLLLHTGAPFPGLETRPVVVEVPETLSLGRIQRLEATWAALRGWGIELAVDDAVLNTRDFAVARVVRAEWLKLDRSLVRRLPLQLAVRQQLHHALRRLKPRGVRVVAEGVETLDELRVLRNLGVPYLQGFLWGRPAPLEHWLQPGVFCLDAAESGEDDRDWPPAPVGDIDALDGRGLLH